MSQAKPLLDQLNIVSSDMAPSIAFYRRLGVEIPDAAIWRTASAAHHANARGDGAHLDLDSAGSRRSGIPAGAAVMISRAGSWSDSVLHRARLSMRPTPI
jgi:hypothetical protein